MRRWLLLSEMLLQAAVPLAVILEGDSEWCASEAAALCATLPGLALAVLRSDAAVQAAGVASCWAAAVQLCASDVFERISDVDSRIGEASVESQLWELSLLLTGLQAAGACGGARCVCVRSVWLQNACWCC